MFCESLVSHTLPNGERAPSEWITDQPWYLFLWRHDPTIQSMLVMLDAIHERFYDVDANTVWARLIDPEDPAIWFLLLPLSGLGSDAVEDMRPEDLYIKMNSRGVPLTEFERFKAHFEKSIQRSDRVGEFALKVDTTWSDLLWNVRGNDNLIDDEFLRYLEFITEVCEWRDGRADGSEQHLETRTRAIFGAENPRHEVHLEFLFQALDAWVGRLIPDTFESYFSRAADPKADVSKVRLFFRQDGNERDPLNLFEACCRSYGEMRGRARVFSFGQALMLYAVVLHLIEATDAFPRRVRVLRNLIEASSDELRLDRMPKILDDVHQIIRHGCVDAVAVLNQAQVTDEELKAAFLEQHSAQQAAMFRLEDHELLHGSLSAFELDGATFESRASEFDRLMSRPDLWPELLGALLAVGEYQRQRTNARPFLFGTNSKRYDSAWRELLTGAARDSLQPTRDVLAALLDRTAAAPTELDDTLKVIKNDFLARCEEEKRFDWRYYMVKYPIMRDNGSSTYYAEKDDDESKHAAMGYSLCMLRAGGQALNGYYRDPYLLAISRELEDGAAVEDKSFMGYETQPRRLPLTRSGASLRCVLAGYELSPPPEGQYSQAFAAVCAKLETGNDFMVLVPQEDLNGRQVDTIDRIQFGAHIIQTLVAAGL